MIEVPRTRWWVALTVVAMGLTACSDKAGPPAAATADVPDPAAVRIVIDTGGYWQAPNPLPQVYLVDRTVYSPARGPEPVVRSDGSVYQPAQVRAVPDDQIRRWVGRLRAAGVGTRTRWGMPGVADGGTLRIVLGTGGTQVTSVIDSFGLEDIGGPLPADQREARRTVAAVLSEMQATDGGARDFHPTQVILRSRRGCTELTQVETATILPALESSDPFTGSTPTPTAPASPTSWYRPLLPREAGCSGADAPFFVDEARADGR